MTREAKALGMTLAEFIRRAIRKALRAPKEPAWMRYAGLVETENSRSSQSIDEIVYGHKD
jgi:hypothetical protein